MVIQLFRVNNDQNGISSADFRSLNSHKCKVNQTFGPIKVPSCESGCEIEVGGGVEQARSRKGGALSDTLFLSVGEALFDH